ncbi:hypothetical protein ACRE_063330 [Hapsidospora chrysogenum ATCC 11550]|uniref:Uncharacterized protein n=1 Tax=Hapsidospora chrysogenum (strain ATCC 11550 / CBS 779.69 / DSM 880 / IAM 14645 / JCM 23072 / IMI 49137) TaxID=857340 RepID=A0A086T0Q9_HAPC1|nr:hypothetical protein ACRE_063330 [Hapsidospora chrysogenum ATCC 11550]
MVDRPTLGLEEVGEGGGGGRVVHGSMIAGPTGWGPGPARRRPQADTWVWRDDDDDDDDDEALLGTYVR